MAHSFDAPEAGALHPEVSIFWFFKGILLRGNAGRNLSPKNKTPAGKVTSGGHYFAESYSGIAITNTTFPEVSGLYAIGSK